VPAPALAGRLPRGVAFGLLLSIVVVFLAASSAPTPLYAGYQAEWGFSPITTTIVFGTYAIAVLAALLTVGSLSDHVGRRPVLLVALVLQLASLVVFSVAGGVPALLLARIVQGLSTGLAVGAIGAGMLDIDRARGTIANAVAPMTGTATGGLLAGFLVQYLPDPHHLVFFVLMAAVVAQFAGVLLMGETSARVPGARASLRPRLSVSPATRGPLLVAVPIIVAAWALAGFYASLGPALARLVVGSDSALIGGLALFVLAAGGALTVLALRDLAPRAVTLVGATALLLGVAITLVAVDERSTAGFFAGTAIAGIGFGGGFQGAMRTILPLAAPHERAGVLAVVYAVAYVSMGVPAVLGGLRTVHSDIRTSSREYGIAVMALALSTLVGLALRQRAAARATAASATLCGVNQEA
jgi:MFS family permease